jgi:tetratricopeptide (TPR) repeat protein
MSPLLSAAALLCLASCARAPAPAAPSAEQAAIEEAERVVARSPADPAARDALGEALLLNGALDRAERVFGEALELAPSFATAHHGVAMVRYHRGDAEGGAAALRAGLALTPEIDPTYTRTRLLEGLAWAHALAGREREAIEAIEASVAAQGLDAEIAPRVAHVGRARLLLHAGRWPEALAEAGAARAPGAPPFVIRAAGVVAVLAHAGAGDTAAAEPVLAALVADPAAAEHPGVVEARLALALAKGQLDAAAALVPALEQLDPYAAEQASLSLARALHRAGKGADARARLAGLAARHLRSVPSAYARRAAAAELAAR